MPPAPGVKGFQLTDPEMVWVARHVGGDVTTGLAIMIRESGGITNNLNTRNNNPADSRDRGLWQINDHWHPNVPDTVAFDPIRSSDYARELSKGGTDWSHWAASRTTLDLNRAARMLSDHGAGERTKRMNELSLHFRVMDGEGGGNMPWGGGSPVDAVGDAVSTVADALNPFAGLVGYLVKGLALLTSADFWKRVGLVLAGVAIIAVAVAAMLGRTGGPAGMIGSKLTGK